MTEPQPVTYFSKLEPDECWALLHEVEVGRIAWQSPEGMTIMPVNYRIHGQSVIFHTAPQTSLAKLADGFDVAFQADDIDRESAIGWSVLMRGRTAAADESNQTASWLENRKVGIVINGTEISGRVVSGTKRG